MTRALFAAACAAIVSLSACSGSPADSTPSSPAQAHLPDELLGLKVQPENISSKLKNVRRPYVDSVAVFSLRDDDLLRASLQISRFNGAARPKDHRFISTIIGTIGGAASQQYRVEKTDVYATTASDQVLFTWFRGRGMFVLAVDKKYEFPRTLLRRLLASGVTV